MNFTVTRQFPAAKVLVLLASLCFIPSCGKSQTDVGNKDAWVTQADNRNSNSNQNAQEITVNEPSPNKEPEPGSPAPVTTSEQPAKQQTYASRFNRDSDVVAVRRRTAAADTSSEKDLHVSEEVAQNVLAYRYEFSRSSEGAALIARASEQIRFAPPATASKAVSGFDASHYQHALELAEQGMAMLKRQPEPSEPAAKATYRAALLEGLSVRAEVLGQLAANADRSLGGAAETAYREYLAAESNGAKRTRAEHKFASMLYKMDELDRAKSIYEGLVARDVEDIEALAGLVRIHQKIAVTQKAAGKETEAAISSELAASYDERLNKLSSQRPATYADAESADTKTREAERRQEADDAYRKRERGYDVPAKARVRTQTERVVPVRPKTEGAKQPERARRRPGI